MSANPKAARTASTGWIDPFTPGEIQRLVAKFGSPLLVLDCERVRSQYRRLAAALPGVDLHYALKPLPAPPVVEALRELGAWFDLATSGEIDVVRGLGIAPGRCIHTHPIKRERDIRDALDFGVSTFVADNPDEIRKFAKFRERTSLLVRVSFRSPDAIVDLSRKFGCEAEAVPVLLKLARDLDVRVRGLSFHVGSQAADPAKYVEAIRVCRELLASATAAGLGKFDTLDIGGGFPVDYLEPVMPIEEFCVPIRQELGQLPKDLRVIAEPGRYIVATAGIGVASVMGRAEREGRCWYYLDDGLYGNFSGQLYEHAHYRIETLRKGALRPAVLAGPTCDSIDVINDALELPELEIGDVLYGKSMGAYTWASATDFNFFPKPRVVSVNLMPGDGGSLVEFNR
ncbi:MAG TPA: type III PLP-dependent enzyme [Steroidobacteraceae bacterium]|nr:type III PLP-dependent enzyme [Steroidobacteraceae bacterium]